MINVIVGALLLGPITLMLLVLESFGHILERVLSAGMNYDEM